MKKKENKVIIVMLIVMILAIIGVSYAAFNYSREGTTLNSITTGTIKMTYTEDDNIISMSGALPTTDKTGKVRLTDGEYFDFTVSSEISGNTNINYEISAKDVTTSERKIDGSNIKLYLTRLTDDGEEELMTPETYNEEASANDYTGRPRGEMSLYTSSMNSSETNRYRLRMWVDEDYNPQGDGGNLSFSVQINVYGKDGDKPLTAAESLVSKANPEDLDYNSASSEQQKEMWTFTHPKTEQTEALTDYRYIGADPNNYVTFNNELWRIIGVFTVDDGSGKKEQRLKIIRDESIGSYSWDNKDITTGAETDYGENDWTDARINYLLNPGHETESVGGSLYWNKGSGTCYSGSNNLTTSCDFTNTGLNEEAKKLIGNALWYLGGVPDEYYDSSNGLASHFYSYERGVTTYNERSTSWTGIVGLIYPSDYGYATSGSKATDRNTCLNKELYNWTSDAGYSDCYNNNWLFNSLPKFTITPRQQAYSVFCIVDIGHILSNYVHDKMEINPVVYLKSDVIITDGDGTLNSPFELSVQ